MAKNKIIYFDTTTICKKSNHVFFYKQYSLLNNVRMHCLQTLAASKQDAVNQRFTASN